jgi:hypothetical protein
MLADVAKLSSCATSHTIPWQRGFLPAIPFRGDMQQPPDSGLCDCCRRNKRNAHKADRYRPSLRCPVVCPFALLRLANWYQGYRNTAPGGESCPRPNQQLFSGGSGSESAAKAVSALGSAASGGSPASTARTQSHRRTAAPITSQRKGGGS